MISLKNKAKEIDLTEKEGMDELEDISYERAMESTGGKA